VTDQYSEVQKLLVATFPRYKETLEGARQEKEQKKAKTEADYHRAGSKLDMLASLGGKAGNVKERLLNTVNVGGVLGTTEQAERLLGIGKDAVMDAVSVYSAYGDVEELASGKMVEDMGKMLDGVKEEAKASTLFTNLAKK